MLNILLKNYSKKLSRDSDGSSNQNAIIKINLFDFALITRRSEPSSRTFLIGEQPNLWELLHPQDKVSRHRGAELRRRYGRLGGTSLLSPE